MFFAIISIYMHILKDMLFLPENNKGIFVKIKPKIRRMVFGFSKTLLIKFQKKKIPFQSNNPQTTLNVHSDRSYDKVVN